MCAANKPESSVSNYNTWYDTGAAHWDASPGKQVILQALKVCCDADRPLRLLDIGCGTGYLLHQITGLVSNQWQLFGIDFATKAIEQAQSLAPQVTWTCADATDLAEFADSTFDIVTCYGTWEHFSDPRAAVRSAGRVLRHAGWLFALLPTLGIYRTDVADEGFYNDLAPKNAGAAQQQQWNLRRETWASYLAEASFALFDDDLARRCGAHKPGVFYFGVRVNA